MQINTPTDELSPILINMTNKLPPDPVAISPSTLLATITVGAPSHLVRVRGEVVRFTPFTNKGEKEITCIYGELADASGKVTFKLKPSPDLKGEGQHIEIIGAVKTSFSKYTTGFDLRIDGEMVAAYQVDKRPVTLLNDQRPEQPRISLHGFLQNNPIDSLFLITTEIGLKDFLSGAQPVHIERDIRYAIIKISSKTEVFNCLESIETKSDIAGLGIIRGGAATADLRLWDDAEVVQRVLATGLPYYSAVGHSDKLLLIDKYSMESFPVPFAFGQAVGETLGRIRHAVNQDEKNMSLQNLVHTHDVNAQKLKKVILRLSIMLTATTALLFLVIYYLYKHPVLK